jgi:molybdopterin-guanine dinucleotide biosynthesis protein A
MASPKTADINQVTGLILAGGRGARMGGVDKGLQIFRGAPMVTHVIARLLPQVGTMMISANQNAASYESLGWPVWPDQLKDFAGPLAGLQTGLMHCATEYLATVPCDSPFLPLDLVSRLHRALLAQHAELAVAVTGVEIAPLRQPVFCLMKTSVLPHLTRYLLEGGRKADGWYAPLQVVEVFFPDEAGFLNINTPEDLRKFE